MDDRGHRDVSGLGGRRGILDFAADGIADRRATERNEREVNAPFARLTRGRGTAAFDDAVKSFAVSVETVTGGVQLNGFVDTSAQKSAAGHDTSTVPGVKDVKNNLIVK